MDIAEKLTPEVYVQTLKFSCRIFTNTVRENQREKQESHRFNEVRQLPTSWGQRGERSY